MLKTPRTPLPRWTFNPFRAKNTRNITPPGTTRTLPRYRIFWVHCGNCKTAWTDWNVSSRNTSKDWIRRGMGMSFLPSHAAGHR